MGDIFLSEGLYLQMSRAYFKLKNTNQYIMKNYLFIFWFFKSTHSVDQASLKLKEIHLSRLPSVGIKGVYHHRSAEKLLI